MLSPELRQKIQFAFLDERLVPPDHPDSNYHQVSDLLLTPLLQKGFLLPEQVLAVRTDIPAPEAEYSVRVPHIDI